MRIPIQNIYYMLCYAWNKLEERDIVDAQVEACEDILDLLALVLESATTHLLKRGLDRDYIDHHEDRSTLRGKIGFAPSIRRNLLTHAKAHCHFDELHYNVLHNQLIKSTILQLVLCKRLDADIRERLVAIYRRLHGIDEIELSKKAFLSVRLHRNNFFYDFPLKICELIFENNLATEEHGDSKFWEFQREQERMAQLFEEFVRNFYQSKRNQHHYHVRREDIRWNAIELKDGSLHALPKMQTDITLESSQRKLIIDTKYYAETLQTNQYGKETVKSGHLYQLFSYLQNVQDDNLGRPCDGMLLYPKVEKDYDFRYHIHGHKVSVRTIDLNQNWRLIEEDLLGFIKD